MSDFVVRTNIERFERLLTKEDDPERAGTLRILLAQERAKLVVPTKRPRPR